MMEDDVPFGALDAWQPTDRKAWSWLMPRAGVVDDRRAEGDNPFNDSLYWEPHETVVTDQRWDEPNNPRLQNSPLADALGALNLDHWGFSNLNSPTFYPPPSSLPPKRKPHW